MERKEIVAITEDEFSNLLKRENLYQEFKSSKLTCYKCGNVIGFHNLFGYFYKDKKLMLLCDNNECVGK